MKDIFKNLTEKEISELLNKTDVSRNERIKEMLFKYIREKDTKDNK
jgi:hypothetical protein